jgi:hypothetical protein
MDLNKLRELSQQKQNELENKAENEVLKLCNPQEIAKELMSVLEENATEAAKEGERTAESYFIICHEWKSSEDIIDFGNEGPFVNIDWLRRNELSEVLFNMVKRYISDSNIQLTLDITDLEDIRKWEIKAILSW